MRWPRWQSRKILNSSLLPWIHQNYSSLETLSRRTAQKLAEKQLHNYIPKEWITTTQVRGDAIHSGLTIQGQGFTNGRNITITKDLSKERGSWAHLRLSHPGLLHQACVQESPLERQEANPTPPGVEMLAAAIGVTPSIKVTQPWQVTLRNPPLAY